MKMKIIENKLIKNKLVEYGEAEEFKIARVFSNFKGVPCGEVYLGKIVKWILDVDWGRVVGWRVRFGLWLGN